MTTLMLILIAAGVIVALAGLIYAAVRGWRLYKSVRKTQAEVDELLRVLTEKQETAMRTAEKIQTDQVLLQERVAELQRTLQTLGFLLREVSAARSRLNLLS